MSILNNNDFNKLPTFCQTPLNSQIRKPNSMCNIFAKCDNVVFQPLTPRNFSLYNKQENHNLSFNDQKPKNINKKEKTHPLDFYTMGKFNKKSMYSTTYDWNKGFQSTSNNILTRNELSLNSRQFFNKKINKKLSTIRDQNITENNYMDPIKAYKTLEQYNLPKYATNFETYNIMKEKIFTKDTENTITKGKNITKNEFLIQKENLLKSKNNNNNNSENKNNEKNNDIPKKSIVKSLSTPGFKYKDPTDYSKQQLLPNYLYFDKNENQLLKNRKWPLNNKITKIHKVSKETPEWFTVFPDWKIEQCKELLAKNEDTISIISKQQGWITVTPKTNYRKRPLEKMKAENMEVTSRIMPKWMEIRHKNEKNVEYLKSIEYYPIRQKCKKLMVFVDKDLNLPKNKTIDYDPHRSIFSYNDFRHNVVTKKEHEYYDKKVSQLPKKFFDWDDGTVFDPKYKRDVEKIK